jgi:hypothetical protein
MDEHFSDAREFGPVAHASADPSDREQPANRFDARHDRRYSHGMNLFVHVLFVFAISASAAAAAEQCRFVEARAEREACYQRQEAARAVRQKAQETLEAQQAAQQKPYEPMSPEDAQLAKSMRGICRGC